MTKLFVYMIILWSTVTTAFGLWGVFHDLPVLRSIPGAEGTKILTYILPIFVSVAIIAALSALHRLAGHYFSRGKYLLVIMFLFCLVQIQIGDYYKK